MGRAGVAQARPVGYHVAVSVIRLDLADLSAPVVDADGVLHVEAVATRAGVFEYVDSDGVHGEYRPPEEVFAPDALRSLMGAPVTVGHVDTVTPANVRALRVGVVEGEPRQDGALLAVCLRLDEPSVIERVLSGTLKELSLGYRCDIEQVSGIADGKRYTMVQRNHRANHVALLPPGKARAGSVASIRLDAAEEADPKELETPEEEKKDVCEPDAPDAEKKDADPLEGDAPAADPAPAAEDVPADAPAEPDLATQCAELRQRVAALESLLAAAVTRADSAEGKVKTLKRTQLERDVARVLPALRCDGVDSAELQAKVIERAFPAMRLDGQGDEYREGVFAAAVNTLSAGAPKSVAGAAGATADPVAAARAERDARHAAAWRGQKA
jgi:hypothetical protein